MSYSEQEIARRRFVALAVRMAVSWELADLEQIQAGGLPRHIPRDRLWRAAVQYMRAPCPALERALIAEASVGELADDPLHHAAERLRRLRRQEK